MTSRGKLFLLAAIVLYLAGTSNDSQPAYTYASALLGILLGAYVLSRLSASGLRLTPGAVPQTVQARAPFRVQVRLGNLASLPKRRARLRGRLAPVSFAGPAEDLCLRLPPIPRGASATLELTSAAPWRGLWRLEGLRLEGSDPLGLYVRPEAPVEDAQLVATPAYFESLPVPWAALLSQTTRMRMAAKRADLGDYRSLREYYPGDDLRRVHWRATAHRAKLMVKEYDEPLDLEAQVWLAAVGEQGRADLDAELAISVAATLARAFVAGGVPTVVRAAGLPPGSQGPGRGDYYWRQLLTTLGDMRYSSPWEVAGLAYQWGQKMGPASAVYVVSNDAVSLAALAAGTGGFHSAAPVFTGPEAEAPPWALAIHDYDAIPAALVRVGKVHGPPGAAHRI